MTFQRPRGPGTWEEVQEMLKTVGRYFLDRGSNPMRDGPFLYGEGGLAIWKRIEFPFDLGRDAMMALDEPGFDEERWVEKGDTENVIGYTPGGSREELSWLRMTANAPDTRDDPRIEVFFIGENRELLRGSGVTSRNWVVRIPGKFEVLYRELSTFGRAEYFYIYRRDGWLGPVIDGRFQGARFGIDSRGEGLYWEWAWTEEPLNGKSLLWGARRHEISIREGGASDKHTTVKARKGLGPVWVWGYVPLEDILWMDYGLTMHLTANRCKVVGAMLKEPTPPTQSLGYVAASDTGRGRFIPLVEYLQNQGWIWPGGQTSP